ncbi:MAG: hypothetical protein ACRDF0_03975, partial [Candidatus Limnocylindria bacterium]
MRELLEGRRLGFSPRPQLGHVAVGLAIATTLLDLMAWFQWGPRDTNGLVVGAYAAAIATAVAAGIAALMAAVELTDTPREERPLARLDLIAALAGVALAGGSAALRA